MMRLGLAALVVVGASLGCASTSGSLHLVRPAVGLQLDQRNFKMVRTAVSAEYSVDSILCLIPTGPTKRHGILLSRLNTRADLKPNQLLFNVAEDQVTEFYLFWCRSTYTLTADVIEVGGRLDEE